MYKKTDPRQRIGVLSQGSASLWEAENEVIKELLYCRDGVFGQARCLEVHFHEGNHMANKASSGRARSAKSGRFVTIKYAHKHPATTVVEKRKK
jgi:hypothetical protein